MREIDGAVTGARVDVGLTVDMPRDRVWELVTDVPRIGEWSPECRSAAWLGTTAPGRLLGARFEAYNRYPEGGSAWVTCVVTQAERPHRFAWVVLDDSGDPARPGSIWRYELLPADAPGRTLVRHTFVHGPGETGLREASRHDPASLSNRLTRLRRNMTSTIAAMTQCENPVEEES